MAFHTAEAVEAAFYQAFAECDSDAMRTLWAEGEVVCMHPGALPLLSHESVMRSWEHMFTGARMPALSTRLIKRIATDDMALHLVEERVGEPAAIVLATNVYRQIGGSWLMVSHQGVLMSSGRAPDKRTLQ